MTFDWFIHIHGSFWGDKMPLIMRNWACMSTSVTKFDTRENIMESVFVFLQFPRRPEKWHNSRYHTTTALNRWLHCHHLLLISWWTSHLRPHSGNDFCFLLSSLRLLGLVVLESRVPSISFLSGIFQDGYETLIGGLTGYYTLPTGDP